MRVPKRQEKSRFWERVRAGIDRTEAARRAGVSATSARRWFRQAGGVLPPSVPETSRARYLSIREREEIFAGVERGDSIRRIAKLRDAQRYSPCDQKVRLGPPARALRSTQPLDTLPGD